MKNCCNDKLYRQCKLCYDIPKYDFFLKTGSTLMVREFLVLESTEQYM